MREIKFRGKSQIDGKWVHGSLIMKEFQIPNLDNLNELKYIKYYEICCKDENDWTSKYNNVPVFENSIGQFTDLKDKNAKEIYEGDIVELHDKVSNIHWTAIVEFGNPNAEYTWGWQLKLLNILEPTGTKRDYWNKDILLWVELEIPQVSCEVIGNIYDNPELLKENENGNK